MLSDYYIHLKEDIINNFDVSVIMPFYKKLEMFKKVFPKNLKFFQRNGIEIILVLDSPEEKDELIAYINQFPFINWKIILNDKHHKWRNPSKALNVGIRHSSKKFIFICSPETQMLTDVIYQLRKSFEDYSTLRHFAIGRVCFAGEEDIDITTYNNYPTIPFGSIMVEKKDLYTIHGYDETLSEWGGDDNNLRARLEMIGVSELYNNDALMIHRESNKDLMNQPRRHVSNLENNIRKLKHFFYPEKPQTNDNSWGYDFNNIIFDWEHKSNWTYALKYYVERNFHKYSMSENIINFERFGVLLLVQSYNESRFISEFLLNVSDYVDGIILLDDESTDGSYEIAANSKLILKASKKREYFNDIENRNILLKLASFCPHELCLFLDVDERLSGDKNSIRDLIGIKNTTFLLPFVHLWDRKNNFNCEYPGSHEGLCFKYRLFSNIGYSQIISNMRLHFRPVPSICNSCYLPAPLILHKGTLAKKDRIKKYNFYTAEDTEKCQLNYDHFSASYSPQKKSLTSLTTNRIKQTIKIILRQL